MISFEDMINKKTLKVDKSHIDINSKGHLTICSWDTVELISKLGSPLFVFNEEKIIKNYRNMKKSFEKYYEKFKISFAYKSNSVLSIIRIYKEEGAYADVVSGGEYYKALTVGVEPGKIIVNGNNKSRAEIKNAIMHNSIINVDSLDELEMIINESKK